MTYESVIGLEVHAQLLTKTKLFCRCENVFGRKANTLTCPVCLGLPGALPVLNSTAVTLAVRTGVALKCAIQPRSIFARKNYFYPDLPKGYQISQFDHPLCTNGKLTIETESGTKEVGITRVHMEEDAGKLLHGDNLLTIEGSLVDLNRAGVPLVEIVSEPDMRSASEASHYLRKLRSILRYIEVCDGNMEEGSFRCDANISLRPAGAKEFGTKVELKNMNSFKHVEKAIEFEIERQKAALEAGQKIPQETRLWNPDKGITRSMRSKEESHDYRYFPEPDLLPLEVPKKLEIEVRQELPELPDQRRARFEKQLKLPAYDAEVLTADKETADYFEENLRAYAGGSTERAKAVSNVVMSEILAIAKDMKVSVKELKLTPSANAAAMLLVDKGTISGKMAKEIRVEIARTGKDPETIVREKGLEQISDEHTIRKAVAAAIAENPTQLAQYRGGKDKLFGFFVGQVMKATQGKANPELVNRLLKEELSRGV